MASVKALLEALTESTGVNAFMRFNDVTKSFMREHIYGPRPAQLGSWPVSQIKATFSLKVWAAAGAIGYFKNPLSHREIGIDDARQAASRILFANELIAIAILQYRLLYPDAITKST